MNSSMTNRLCSAPWIALAMGCTYITACTPVPPSPLDEECKQVSASMRNIAQQALVLCELSQASLDPSEPGYSRDIAGLKNEEAELKREIAGADEERVMEICREMPPSMARCVARAQEKVVMDACSPESKAPERYGECAPVCARIGRLYGEETAQIALRPVTDSEPDAPKDDGPDPTLLQGLQEEGSPTVVDDRTVALGKLIAEGARVVCLEKCLTDPFPQSFRTCVMEAASHVDAMACPPG